MRIVSSIKYIVSSMEAPCKNLLIAFFILYTLYFILYTTVEADNMESSSYRIQMGTINIGGKSQSSDNYRLGTSLGQTVANEFSSDGYIVKAGFQYIHSIIPFRFSLSSTNINLGTLAPNTPATATTTLTVYFGGAGQYIVTAAEEGPLRTFDGNTNISDTACNGGGDTCSESTSAIWNSNSAYGFGYNMSGNDIPVDFTNSTYYRPFPNRLASESPVTVMSRVNVGKNRQSTMTFKANISNLQPAGTYQTVIKFVATPSY